LQVTDFSVAGFAGDLFLSFASGLIAFLCGSNRRFTSGGFGLFGLNPLTLYPLLFKTPAPFLVPDFIIDLAL
jgi:hypothetical protein